MRDPDRFLAYLAAQDAELVSAGWPSLSPWWLGRIERFARSRRRRWVPRVGRRGGKSSSLCRVATCWGLFGEWSVPPGDTAVIPFVSIDRGEAAERLKTIRSILDVLGVTHHVRGDRIDVPSRNLAFRVATCSVGGTVGFTSVAVFADEMARWESKETSANPAKEVMGSLRPTMATIPEAFEVDSSSPWTTSDYHAVLFDAGDDNHQLVDHGTTWEANPTLTEEETRRLEPDERTWTREYAAIPSAGIENDWFGDAACDPTFLDDPEWFEAHGVRNGMAPVFTIDPAFANDYFGYAVVTSEPANDGTPRRLTCVQHSGARRPDGEPRQMLEWVRDSVFRKAQRDASNEKELMTVYTDQAEFYSLRDVAKQLGITLILVPWTGGEHEKSKATRFRAVRTAMRGGEVRIRAGGALQTQFRSVKGVLLPSGNERIEYKRVGPGHCDELSAVMMGLSVALEMPARAAKPLAQPAHADDPRKWRDDAVRKVNERRAREMKRSPGAVMKKAMGL